MKFRSQTGSYEYIPGTSLILPTELLKYYNGVISIEEDIYEKEVLEALRSKITDDEIEKKIANLKDLTLQLTQDCNFRCKYCGYSGIYTQQRVHSKKNMSLDLGRKAVNFFLEDLHSPLRTIREYPAITFYGGEPFMQYSTMMALINYVITHPLAEGHLIKFIANTNGYLLTPNRMHEIVSNELRVDISLDGPEQEHDKFRRTSDGSPTWEKITKNIDYLRNVYPDYFKNHVRIFLTLHPYHDLLKIEEFLIENDFFNEHNVFINPVTKRGLNFDQYKSLSRGYEKLVDQVNNELDKTQWVYRIMVEKGFDEKFKGSTSKRTKQSSFTGTCFPGAIRLFVDVNGSFHICEKVLERYPIGNIEQGFDYKSIRKIVNTWRAQIIERKCWKCPIWNFCTFCFATNWDNDKLLIKGQECSKLQDSKKKSLERHLNNMEIRDNEERPTIVDIDTLMHSL